MGLNPGKCHFMLFGIKENEQFDQICSDVSLKDSSNEKTAVTIDNELPLMSILLISAKQLTKNLTLSVE